MRKVGAGCFDDVTETSINLGVIYFLYKIMKNKPRTS